MLIKNTGGNPASQLSAEMQVVNMCMHTAQEMFFSNSLFSAQDLVGK